MSTDLIHDRGRGPEIKGTRITVYNLLPDFLDANVTEAHICKVYGINPEQVSAARAYVLNHSETVLAEHMRIEARMAAGNPPEVIEQAQRTHATPLRFREWLAERQEALAQEPARTSAHESSHRLPSFREWLADQESRPKMGL